MLATGRQNLEALEGSPPILVRGGRDLGHVQGVTGGLVLEGHPHHHFAAQSPVHLLWPLQILQKHDHTLDVVNQPSVTPLLMCMCVKPMGCRKMSAYYQRPIFDPIKLLMCGDLAWASTV